MHFRRRGSFYVFFRHLQNMRTYQVKKRPAADLKATYFCDNIKKAEIARALDSNYNMC